MTNFFVNDKVGLQKPLFLRIGKKVKTVFTVADKKVLTFNNTIG